MRQITESELALLSFTRTQVLPTPSGRVTMWGGHRLVVTRAENSIKVKMQGCGCPLIQAPAYSFEKMTALVAALTLSPDEE